MIKRVFKDILKHIELDQKKVWDGIAFSFLSQCDRIIDVGCGEGRFIAQDKGRIVGIDWNEVSLNLCKDAGYNVIKSDIRKLPFTDHSISGIHCSHVIEHFFPQDVHQILSEFDRILQVNGILVIRSPMLWDGFYSDLTHIRPYHPKAIIKYLTPSKQRTYSQISLNYQVLYLKWRHRCFTSESPRFNLLLKLLNRLNLPVFSKTGYLLVFKKKSFQINSQ